MTSLEHPTPHDSVFKSVFSTPENALVVLRAALPSPVLGALDVESLRLEPGSFVDEELRATHEDLAFSVRLGGHDAIVYVLLEHQSTIDTLMPLRLLRYVLRLWEAWRRDHPKAEKLPAVIPLVLHQGPTRWTGPRSLADLLDLPPGLRESVGRYSPSLELVLDDLGAVSPEAAAALAGPPLARLARAPLRAALDDTNVAALLATLAPSRGSSANPAAAKDSRCSRAKLSSSGGWTWCRSSSTFAARSAPRRVRSS